MLELELNDGNRTYSEIEKARLEVILAMTRKYYDRGYDRYTLIQDMLEIANENETIITPDEAQLLFNREVINY